MEETVMQIKDMFRKKIDREIQGVIIVGQGEETNVVLFVFGIKRLFCRVC